MEGASRQSLRSGSMTATCSPIHRASLPSVCRKASRDFSPGWSPGRRWFWLFGLHQLGHDPRPRQRRRGLGRFRPALLPPQSVSNRNTTPPTNETRMVRFDTTGRVVEKSPDESANSISCVSSASKPCIPQNPHAQGLPRFPPSLPPKMTPGPGIEVALSFGPPAEDPLSSLAGGRQESPQAARTLLASLRARPPSRGEGHA